MDNILTAGIDRYISVNVLSDRNSNYDCSANGASIRENALHLIPHPRGNWSDEDMPGLEESYNVVIWDLRERNIGSNTYINARPRELADGVHSMMGGNYLSSSDSRFSEYNRYPIPCHDRVEG